jgi:hypothetical protein
MQKFCPLHKTIKSEWLNNNWQSIRQLRQLFMRGSGSAISLASKENPKYAN